MRILLLLVFNAAIFACGLWDIVATARGEYNEMISPTLLDWSKKFPILPLALGICLGHFFWPQVIEVPVIRSEK